MLESVWYLYGVETTIDARQWQTRHTRCKLNIHLTHDAVPFILFKMNTIYALFVRA